MIAQPSLFDVTVEQVIADAPRIRAMRGAYGRVDGRICGECAHLVPKVWTRKVYSKCMKYGDSRGAGTDWRKKWPACGLWRAAAEE